MTRHPARRLCALVLSAWAGLAWAGDAPVVSGAWARATPPGTDVGAAYLVIQGGTKPDKLLGGTSDRAAMVHLHAVETKDGVSKMRALESLEIPAGQPVKLAPNSTHLMLMGLSSPLVAGQTFLITLQFAHSEPQVVSVTVRPATASDDAAQHKH
jgi:copper(I)-binding protein